MTARPAPITSDIAAAADALRLGKLVAIPTETVYGLAARADDDAAVRRIYEVKKRPAASPLIVHVADLTTARSWVSNMPDAAVTLAQHFWPGPLTMVLPASDQAASTTRAGGSTIALRVPDHPVTRELLRVSDLGLAAPSANPHTRVSPTAAEHVAAYFDASDVAMVLNGGPCEVGIESTIVDLTGATPTVLRWGQITPRQIAAVVGSEVREQINSIDVHAAHPITTGTSSAGSRSTDMHSADRQVRVPGQERVHYAPHAQVVLADNLADLIEQCASSIEHVGVIAATDTPNLGSMVPHAHVVLATADADEFARRLYAALHEVDARKLSRVVVLMPDAGTMAPAVRDRLQRAASAASQTRLTP